MEKKEHLGNKNQLVLMTNLDELDIFLILVISFRLIIGIRLFYIAKNTELKSQYLNSADYIINIIANIFLFSFIKNEGIYLFFLMGALIVQLFFINRVFGKERKTAFKQLLIVNSTLFILISYNELIYTFWEYNVRFGLFILMGLSIFSFFTYEAIKAYSMIRSNAWVEDWIKMRYKLLISNGLILIFIWILTLFSSGDTENTTIMGLIALFTITTLIIQFVAWVMPSGLKRHFNRNYNPMVLFNEEDLDILKLKENKEEMVKSNTDMIHLLSEKLSFKVIFPLIQCKGLIEGAYYLYMDENHPQKKKDSVLLNYNSWKTLLETFFKDILAKTSLPNQENILNELKDELKKHQSLVSLAF